MGDAEPPPYDAAPSKSACPPQLGYSQQPGYNQQPGYPPMPGYSSQPGNHPQPGYPTQQDGYAAQPRAGNFPASGPPPAPCSQGYIPPQAWGPRPVPAPAPNITNQNSTTVVINQPRVLATEYVPPLNDYLTLAVISCLCFFWPIGILAILKSIEARNLYTERQFPEAHSAALRARNLGYSSIVAGIVLYILIIIISSAK